ncbi:Uncharacterised protein [Chlamydia abortus]|uniref:FxLYD domain-containing protein n=1 Tax=Paenibacillus residui TaxID=629724 RepID=A0ABW3D7L5_9BACL|nr:FxLYD domain-containing protein [Paenibacillus sp. 32O-W]SHE13965.1 Uncharacterised protein [Chlamydia abortus]
MNITSIFITPWASIALVLTVVAAVSLILGKYDRKTILSGTLKAFLSFYAITVFVNGVIQYESFSAEQHMNEILDRQFETIQQQKSKLSTADQLVIAVSSGNDDGDYISEVYVGNYSQQHLASGKLNLMLYNKDGNKVISETIEVTDLKPGERRKLKRIYTDDKIEQFRYRWMTYKTAS